MTPHPRSHSILPPILAGFIVVLVGFTSSVVLLFQAGHAFSATPEQLSSILSILCIAMGSLSVIFSIYYRSPILIAWSSPGSALLAASLPGTSIHEAIGAFLFSAFLIFLSGATGWFEKLMNKIPTSLASALLAGVLFRFGLDVFHSIQTQAWIALTMFCSYIFMKIIQPRYAVVTALALGILCAGLLGLLNFEQVHFQFTHPVWIRPALSYSAILGIGVPLFIVTMASQNMAGIAALKNAGYPAPISPVLTWTGITNFLLAPFGAFALNFAAITAAIAMGPESHPDPKKRYIAGISSGILYAVLGLMAATVASIFDCLPKELILVIAGLALFSTISGGLHTAMKDERSREAALITFLITVSGVSFFGIGSAFWAVIAGGGVLWLESVRSANRI